MRSLLLNQSAIKKPKLIENLSGRAFTLVDLTWLNYANVVASDITVNIICLL